MNSVFFKVSRFFVYLVPLSLIVVVNSTLFPFVVGKYVWFRASVDLALVFFALGFIFSRDKDSVARSLWGVLKSPLTIAVTVFVFVFLLAGFFGADPHLSFWSNFERGEGGLQMLHLLVFFILAGVLFREEHDWKVAMGWFLAGSLGVVLFGLNQPGAERFGGTLGNPAYAGACLLFALFYSIFFLLKDFRGRLKSAGGIFLTALSAVFLLFFLFSGTRGALAGFMASLLVFFGYIAFRSSKGKKVFSAILVFLVVFGLVIAYLIASGSFKTGESSYRILNFSFADRNFTDRLITWKVAWNGFLERPILGWGPENFPQVFVKHFDPAYFQFDTDFNIWFDRAHSVVFDPLVETGAVGFLSFIAIFVVFFHQFFRRNGENDLFTKALILSFPVAYLVQSLVLFNTLPIYLNLFFFLSFSAGHVFRKNP
jgi:O-antigen ligase